MNNKYTTLRDGTKHLRIINGCWQFSSGHSDDTISGIKTLSQYIKKWYSCFDWADIYTWVEELFGQINIQFWANKNIRFHTKHVPDLDDITNWKINYKKTEKTILRSMNRINTSILHNVQFHWWDYAKPWYEISIQVLQDLQKKWKIQHIGITNTNVDFLKKLENKYSFIPMTTQNQYSIIDRRPENKLIDHLNKKNIWLYCYGSLMWWLLSKKYLWINKPEEPLENRSLRKYLRIIDDWADWDLFQILLNTLENIWTKYNASISEIAASWVLHQKWVNSIIIWTRSSKHIWSLNTILNINLTRWDLEKINTVYSKWKPLIWDVFDLERYEPRHRDIMKFNLNKK